ncbi:unnamed protein product [Symbiodinium natans]|uniref:Uncharacterized protein n=1 Tax=Symbiodinium natans TaxID=878477 RepID=A0A812GWP2_9DINO|nr:unnamed protein product [Symbiodinium natans]
MVGCGARVQPVSSGRRANCHLKMDLSRGLSDSLYQIVVKTRNQCGVASGSFFYMDFGSSWDMSAVRASESTSLKRFVQSWFADGKAAGSEPDSKDKEEPGKGPEPGKGLKPGSEPASKTPVQPPQSKDPAEDGGAEKTPKGKGKGKESNKAKNEVDPVPEGTLATFVSQEYTYALSPELLITSLQKNRMTTNKKIFPGTILHLTADGKMKQCHEKPPDSFEYVYKLNSQVIVADGPDGDFNKLRMVSVEALAQEKDVKEFWKYPKFARDASVSAWTMTKPNIFFVLDGLQKQAFVRLCMIFALKV